MPLKNIISAATDGARNTVMSRIELLSKNLNEEQQRDLVRCVAFSLELDESTDIMDTAQLLSFIRMVFDDLSTRAELLTMIYLKGRTRGIDLFTEFKHFVGKINLPLFKLVSLTKNGAPAMIGVNNGFISLCDKDKEFPDFINYHCLIHQQVL